MEIPVYDWSQVRKEQLNPEVARQVIHGEKMTVARFFLKRGAVVPEHSHDNEEITVLEQGRVRLFISGEEQLAVAGQAIPRLRLWEKILRPGSGRGLRAPVPS